MKTLFQSFICGCMAIAGYFSSAEAQDIAFTTNTHLRNERINLLTNTTNTAPATKPAVNVNIKVLRAFVKAYKSAENSTWFNNGSSYLVMFDQDGMKAHASFGKDGYWYYDVRFGSEKDLPAAVRHLIKSNYVDYTITKATEVNVGGEKAWVVNLEDANNLVLARVIDRALDELARYDTRAKEKTHRRRH